MNIGIDLDDVTVKLLDGLLNYLNNKYNTNFKFEEHIQFDLDKIWKCSPEEAMKRVYDFYSSNYMELVLPIDGAINSIYKLSKKHNITFITSRPVFLKEKTNRWLKYYFPHKVFPVYFTNQYTFQKEARINKSDICKKLDIKLMIEDSPANTIDLVSNNIKVLLFNRPWNSSIANTALITRVNNWKDVLKILN